MCFCEFLFCWSEQIFQSFVSDIILFLFEKICVWFFHRCLAVVLVKVTSHNWRVGGRKKEFSICDVRYEFHFEFSIQENEEMLNSLSALKMIFFAGFSSIFRTFEWYFVIGSKIWLIRVFWRMKKRIFLFIAYSQHQKARKIPSNERK